jgi:hypothetical protein
MRTKAKPSLLEQASAISGNQDWIERLPPDQRSQVVELLQAKLDGKIPIGRETIVKLLRDNGIETTESGIRRALLKLGGKPK